MNTDPSVEAPLVTSRFVHARAAARPASSVTAMVMAGASSREFIFLRFLWCLVDDLRTACPVHRPFGLMDSSARDQMRDDA